MATGWGKLHCECPYTCETWRAWVTSFSYDPFISCLFWFGFWSSFFLLCGSYVFHLTVIFVLGLLVVSVCACLLTGVAQCELLVNSLSNLASRALITWQWEKLGFYSPPTPPVRLVQWRARGGLVTEKSGNWCRGSRLRVTWRGTHPCPWRALRLRCLRSFKSYSLVLLLIRKRNHRWKNLSCHVGTWLSFIGSYRHSPSYPTQLNNAYYCFQKVSPVPDENL